MQTCIGAVKIEDVKQFRISDRYAKEETKNMRIWFKMMKDNHLLRDYTYEDESDDTRTHKIFRGIDEACRVFDLSKPIWLDATIAEFKRHAKARFTKDCFIEEIDFAYLEIHVIAEG